MADDDRSRVRIRELLTGQNAALCLAVSFSFASTWLLNAVGYPVVNDFCPSAQYAASLAGGLAAMGFAFASLYWPRLFTSVWTAVAAFVLITLSTTAMYASAIWESDVLAITGACVRWIACVLRDIVLGFALMSLTSNVCLAVLVGGYFLRYVWIVALWALPAEVRMAALFLFAPIGIVLLWPAAKPVLGVVAESDTPANLSVTNPMSFLPFSNRMFLAIMLFHAALGFSTTYGAATSGYAQGGAVTLVLFALVLAVALTRGIASIDLLYGASYLLALAGLLLVPGLGSGEGIIGSLCNSFCEASSSLFLLVLWFLVARIGARSPIGALPVLCMVRAARGFGIGIGALSGAFTEYLAVASSEWMMLFVAAMVFCFCAYNFMFTRTFSFDETVRGVQPLVEARPAWLTAEAGATAAGVGAAAGDGTATEGAAAVGDGAAAGGAAATAAEPAETVTFSLDCAAAEVVSECHLTPREADVLGLLARGRNVAYIQEELSLTRNTVKSYVSDVYDKLGVHSHQELIDLVESRMRG